MHYHRWQRYGSPDAPRLCRPKGEALAFFHAHVMESSDGCRIWPYKRIPWPWGEAPRRRGYGMVWLDGRWQYVHQLTCTRWNGPRLEGMEVAHLCDDPGCWAGEHLRWASHRENMGDRVTHRS
jgi:hypothetical protein